MLSMKRLLGRFELKKPRVGGRCERVGGVARARVGARLGETAWAEEQEWADMAIVPKNGWAWLLERAGGESGARVRRDWGHLGARLVRESKTLSYS